MSNVIIMARNGTSRESVRVNKREENVKLAHQLIQVI